MNVKLRTCGPGGDFKDIEVPPVICCGFNAVLDSSVDHIAQDCYSCGRRYVVNVFCFKQLAGLSHMDKVE